VNPSNIARIVDYTAQRAALVQGLSIENGSIVGVRSVYGAGQGLYADPLRPGAMIQPCPEKPSEPLQHWSKLPDAPTIEWVSQTSAELTWTIPMTLWISPADAATAAQVALPFYNGYLAAFATDPALGGLCLVSTVKSFKPGGDSDWFWLDVELEVTELVSY
jgi:hypothetical protein